MDIKSFFLNLFRKDSKKGALEIETIIKWAIILVVLAVVAFAVTSLLKGGGGRLLDGIKDSLKFGGP